MNQANYAILGVIVGALATMASNLLLDSAKTRREQRSVASAIAASIRATLELAEEKKYIELFTAVMDAARNGVYLPIGKVAAWRQKFTFDPLVDEYVGKFGLLPADLPGDVTRFYTLLNSVRNDIERISDDEFATNLKQLAKLIEEDLVIWKKIVPLGNEIIFKLRYI